MRLSAFLMLSALLAASAAVPARAGMDIDLAKSGQQLAEQNCGACHAISPGAASPNEAAPPFADVAKLYPPETLEEALAEGIMVGHEQMPAFEFTPDQVEQIIAYLKTLE